MADKSGFTLRSSMETHGVVVVEVVGELDIRASSYVREELLTAVERPDEAAVVVDLTGLEFIDTSGIHMLFEASSRLRERDGSELVVAGCGRQVERIFEAIRIDTRLRWVEGLDEAIASTQTPSEGAA